MVTVSDMVTVRILLWFLGM
jgi:hypothetical protein